MSDKKQDNHLSILPDKRLEDEEDEGGSSGARALNPFEQGTILIEATEGMEDIRRQLEQRGHSQFARVNASDRTPNYEVSPDNDLTQEAGPKAHPFLDSQRFDGIDPSLNPAPDIGTSARTEFDNERRNQEQEKQYRLGNMPTNSNRNTPEFKR